MTRVASPTATAAKTTSAPKAAAGARTAAPTPTQLLVLAYLRSFYAQQDQLPTVALVARHFGWATRNGAQYHVDALVRHGLIEINACGRYRFARKEGGT